MGGIGNTNSKYSLEEIKALISDYIQHRKEGYSKESFPGCDYRTIETHLEERRVDLQTEIKLLAEAEREARKYWESLGIKLVRGDINGSAPAWMFNMKNRYRGEWKDKTETGFTNNEGEDIHPVQIIQLPDNGRSNPPAEPKQE